MWLCLCWAVALIYSKVYMLPVVLFYCFGFSRWQKGKFLHVVSMQIKKVVEKGAAGSYSRQPFKSLVLWLQTRLLHGELSLWRSSLCFSSAGAGGATASWTVVGWPLAVELSDLWLLKCPVYYFTPCWRYKLSTQGREQGGAASWLARHAGLFLRAPQTRAQGLAIPSSFLNLLQPPWTFSHSGCSLGRALLLRVTEGVEGHAGVCDLFLAFEVAE